MASSLERFFSSAGLELTFPFPMFSLKPVPELEGFPMKVILNVHSGEVQEKTQPKER
jgi:hypothetical protein